MTALKIAGAILFYLGGYIAMHIFIHREVVKGLRLKKWVGGILTLLMIFIGTSLITSRILEGFFNTKLLYLIGATWFGILFTAFPIFLIELILRLIFKNKRKLFTIIALSLTIILTITAMFISRFGLHIKDVEIQYKNLPGELDGYTIIQISDLHLGSLTSVKWFERVVEMVKEENPDLIVITGDLLDSEICEYQEYCNLLKTLNSDRNVYAIPGNHEYYAGFEHFKMVVKESDLKLLLNDSDMILEEILYVIGIDDPTGKRGGEGPDIVSAIKGIPEESFSILLSHRPEYWDEVKDKGVDLTLAGHTHAGQIFPNDLIIQFYMKYHYGLYEKNESFLYTTSGTGTWGPPMRLFTRSEIVKITLRNAE